MWGAVLGSLRIDAAPMSSQLERRAPLHDERMQARSRWLTLKRGIGVVVDHIASHVDGAVFRRDGQRPRQAAMDFDTVRRVG